MASRDYEEFIDALNVRGVKYLIVGAHAVAFHAQPRATKDLDILVEATPENAARVLEAMSDFFGGADLGYVEEDLLDADWIVQLGVAPIRIDLHAGLDGLDHFDHAWSRRIDAPFGTVSTHYLSLEDLVRVKEAAGREQDRADLAVLRKIRP
jgi:hypothetical protein